MSNESLAHAINIFDGDSMFREFAMHMAVNLDRLNANGCMPAAVALREDLWPGITNWDGYPVIRLSAHSPVPWGVVT